MSSAAAALAAAAGSPDDAPLGPAGALYADPDWFAVERAGLLRRSWHALGRADEVREPGDYFTTSVMGEPLIVVRGDDGAVNVLADVCAHRGMPVSPAEKGRIKRFVCPYHAWSFGRDGALASAPRMPKTRCKGLGLRRWRSEVWRGFVYVNFDDDAPPLTDGLKALGDFIGVYDQDAMGIGHVEHEVWRCNWKLLVENFMESYHLSVVHPETLHPYTPTALSRKGPDGDAFTSYVAGYPDDIPQRFAGAPHLSREERYQSRLFCVYPGQVASQSAGLLVSLSLDPVAVDETRVRWTLSSYEGEMSEGQLAEAVALWREVNREDREKLERMQLNMSSAAARGGPLGPPDLEGPVRDFHKYLAREMG